MIVNVFALAKGAKIEDRMLCLDQIFDVWTRRTPGRFRPQNFYVCLQVQARAIESPLKLELKVLNEEEDPIGPTIWLGDVVIAPRPDGIAQPAPAIFLVDKLELEAPADYTLVLLVDGEESAKYELHTRVAT